MYKLLRLCIWTFGITRTKLSEFDITHSEYSVCNIFLNIEFSVIFEYFLELSTISQ